MLCRKTPCAQELPDFLSYLISYSDRSYVPLYSILRITNLQAPANSNTAPNYLQQSQVLPAVDISALCALFLCLSTGARTACCGCSFRKQKHTDLLVFCCHLLPAVNSCWYDSSGRLVEDMAHISLHSRPCDICIAWQLTSTMDCHGTNLADVNIL